MAVCTHALHKLCSVRDPVIAVFPSIASRREGPSTTRRIPRIVFFICHKKYRFRNERPGHAPDAIHARHALPCPPDFSYIVWRKATAYHF